MPQPFDTNKFGAILRNAYEGVKAVDPGATVVLSGLGPVCADSEELFEKVYAGGAKGFFDVAAIHPFPSTAQEVIDALRLNRGVMERHGDGHKPIIRSARSLSARRRQYSRLSVWKHALVFVPHSQ